MFFDGWQGIWRTALVGVLAYLALVVLLRVSGKRTLSKMNAFDLIVTVALGSTLATILLSADVALAEGVTAFAVLIVLQYAIAWLSVRSQTVSNLVKSEPALLVYRGRILPDALRRERVVDKEVWAAVRAEGIADLAHVEAVVLETDGTFTVVPTIEGPAQPTLQNVRGYERLREGDGAPGGRREHVGERSRQAGG
ncbi:MAG TPA: DUF421 domain-containing protein [Chloroflexaceae bacterium]|nr:DUF421 domain-containing protein [Chloroflexaceae bacterium]